MFGKLIRKMQAQNKKISRINDNLSLRGMLQPHSLMSTMNFKFEQGGMLVYDIKAATVKSKYSSQAPQSFHETLAKTEIPSAKQHKGISVEESELLSRIKSMPPCPVFPTSYNLVIPDDAITLTFDGKFECGNLSRAIKLSDYEYNLQILCDHNTFGNNHWYYFSVFNPRKTSVTFNIVNMKRLDSLYVSGMKPAVFSQKHCGKTGDKWMRDCTNVSYTRNSRNDYYTLSFTYNFKFSDDLVYFAYSVPYTYTELSEYLSQIRDTYRDIARVNTLCYSLAGNACEILTITENVRSFMDHTEESADWGKSFGGRRLTKLKRMRAVDFEKEQSHKDKKSVVLTARVHSGEVVSSFMIKGAIDFLMGSSRTARILRRNFIFRIIPMLNPDGVRYGSFRCSLLGVDLNRRWDCPHKLLHPTIYYAKKMIEVLNESHPVAMYCDMHGHTRKKNVFMYGCSQKGADYLDYRRNLLAKVVPVLMASRNRFFSYRDSHFRMERDKKSTARVVLYKLLGTPHVYTMEASFFGPRDAGAFGQEYCGDLHMNSQHLESLGESLAKLCVNFVSEWVFYKNVRYVNEYLRQICRVPRSEGIWEEVKIGEFDEEGEAAEVEEIEERKKEKGGVERGKGIAFNAKQDTEFWDDIEVVEDCVSEEDSGGSDSCPSERESIMKRSKSTLKNAKSRKNYVRARESPDYIRYGEKGKNETGELEKTDNIERKSRGSVTDRFNKNKSLNHKLSILPKSSVNKIPFILKVISPKIGGESVDLVQTTIPQLKTSVNSKNHAESNKTHQSWKNIGKKNKATIAENPSFKDSRHDRDILTPRNYKLNNLSWLGPNAQQSAQKYAINARYLAQKIYSRLTKGL